MTNKKLPAYLRAVGLSDELDNAYTGRGMGIPRPSQNLNANRRLKESDALSAYQEAAETQPQENGAQSAPDAPSGAKSTTSSSRPQSWSGLKSFLMQNIDANRDWDSENINDYSILNNAIAAKQLTNDQRAEGQIYESKMRAVTELANFVKTGTFITHEPAKHQKGFNVGGYNRYAVTFVLDNVVFNGELLVALNDSGQGMFYDIVKIKENGAGYHPIVAGANTVSNNSIRQNSEKSTDM